MKDKNIVHFLDLMKKGEVVYKDGSLYALFYHTGTPYKSPRRMGKRNTKGYIQLTAKVEGKEISAIAHRVIWGYFYGRENLKPELEINHINGVKDDNRIENLELVTPSENQKHAYAINLKRKLYGEENPDSRLSTKQVLRIKELINFGLTDLEISKIYDVTSIAIRHIRRGNTWSHVTGIITSGA